MVTSVARFVIVASFLLLHQCSLKRVASQSRFGDGQLPSLPATKYVVALRYFCSPGAGFGVGLRVSKLAVALLCSTSGMSTIQQVLAQMHRLFRALPRTPTPAQLVPDRPLCTAVPGMCSPAQAAIQPLHPKVSKNQDAHRPTAGAKTDASQHQSFREGLTPGLSEAHIWSSSNRA